MHSFCFSVPVLFSLSSLASNSSQTFGSWRSWPSGLTDHPLLLAYSRKTHHLVRKVENLLWSTRISQGYPVSTANFETTIFHCEVERVLPSVALPLFTSSMADNRAFSTPWIFQSTLSFTTSFTTSFSWSQLIAQVVFMGRVGAISCGMEEMRE